MFVIFVLCFYVICRLLYDVVFHKCWMIEREEFSLWHPFVVCIIILECL